MRSTHTTMAFESPTRRGAKPSFRARPRPASYQTEAHPANRAGDAVQAEFCRQYAEHWFRVSRGQE
jgi:hypothetical protein